MTLAEVFRRHGPAYLAKHLLSSAKAKVWRAIVACRTAVLGGHVETCDGCGVTRHVYHSCRNRHCPQCQTRAKEHWLAKRRQELLPVPYFHLVFTLPHALHALIGQRPRVIYEMLFGAASATLTEFAANRRWLGGKLATYGGHVRGSRTGVTRTGGHTYGGSHVRGVRSFLLPAVTW